MSQSSPRPGRLSAGPVQSWVRGKPRLATDAPKIPGQRQPSKIGYIVGVLLRAGVVLVGLTAGVVAGAWFILSSTVLATPVIGDAAWVVQRAAWVEGKAPIGAFVVANDEQVRADVLDRMAQTITGYPDGYIAVVVAPANSQVASTEDGFLVIDGETTEQQVPAPVRARDLGSNYLAVCLVGSCGEPGTLTEVPVSHVLGEVLWGADWSGIRHPGEAAR